MIAKHGITVYLVAGLATTLLSGYPLYKMSIIKNLKYAFLSFVPFLQLLVIGALIGKVVILDIELLDADFILIGVVAVSIILGYLPAIGFIFMIIQYIIFAIMIMLIIGKINESWVFMGASAIICIFINYLFVAVVWYFYINSTKKTEDVLLQ